MSWFTRYTRSSIGQKQVMALSGIFLVLFLFAHLAGNLLVFTGRDALNNYAVGLRDMGALLWVARGGLLVFFVIHFMAGFAVWAKNKGARKTKYHRFQPKKSTAAGRLMAVSGTLMLLYVGFHLAHFTLGLVYPEYFAMTHNGMHDVHGMVVESFQSPVVVGLYIFAMAAVCLHLYHALPSFFRTLGLTHHRFQGIIDLSGPVVAVVLFLGYSAIPIFILAGAVTL